MDGGGLSLDPKNSYETMAHAPWLKVLSYATCLLRKSPLEALFNPEALVRAIALVTRRLFTDL